MQNYNKFKLINIIPEVVTPSMEELVEDIWNQDDLYSLCHNIMSPYKGDIQKLPTYSTNF